MFDRDGNPTDDADRCVSGLCDTFDSDPAPDFDGMDYDDWHSAPKCARGIQGFACCLDGDGQLIPGHPGCRHCNPPDYEGQPHGFGIERFDGQYDEARRWVRSLASALRLHTWEARDGMFTELAIADGFSPRRARCGVLVWERLVGTCETHTEAVEKYTKWAKRTMRRKYRDHK
jgi:hypothetical protein